MCTQPSNILRMSFKTKWGGLLNLPRIFNQTLFTSFIPKETLNFKTPSEIYTLEKFIQSKIFDFNKFFQVWIYTHLSGTILYYHVILNDLILKNKSNDTHW